MAISSFCNSVHELFGNLTSRRSRRSRSKSLTGCSTVAAEVLELRSLLSGTTASVSLNTSASTQSAAVATPTYALDSQGNLSIVNGNLSTQVASGVQSFAAGKDGHSVYFLTNSGLLQKWTPGTQSSAPVLIDKCVQSFSVANNSQGVVDLTTSGTLEVGAVGPKLSQNVQSFSVDKTGMNVFWLTNELGGGLYESSVSGGVAQWKDGGVQAFALANNVDGFIDLNVKGVLQRGYNGAVIGTGVQSFAVDKDGQNVYWLSNENGGSLYKSSVFGGSAANGGSTVWQDGGVQAFVLANTPNHFIDLNIYGVLHSGYNTPALATDVQSFSVDRTGDTAYWLTNETGGALYRSPVNGGTKEWLDGGVQSFSLTNKAAQYVDLGVSGILREGYQGAVIGTGVQSFAIGAGGQTINWLSNNGTLSKASYSSNSTILAQNVSAFRMAENDQEVISLRTNGSLIASQPSGTEVTLASAGVQTFEIGNGGQDIYWLSNNGNLSQSINTAFGTSIDANVDSFHMADNGQEVVALHTNGVLTATQPHWYGWTLASASGAHSFAIGNGGQDVYWLSSTGALFQSLNTASGTLLDTNVSSFSMSCFGQEVIALHSNGSLTQTLPHYYGITISTGGVQSFAIGGGGQDIYWLSNNGTMFQKKSFTTNASTSIDIGVVRFEMAYNGQEVVALHSWGSLTATQPLWFSNAIATHVSAFGVGRDAIYYTQQGRDFYRATSTHVDFIDSNVWEFGFANGGVTTVFVKGRFNLGRPGGSIEIYKIGFAAPQVPVPYFAATYSTNFLYSQVVRSVVAPDYAALPTIPGSGPTVTYHGGAVLSNVKTQALYFGSEWNTESQHIGQRNYLDGFLKYIVNSPYMDMLTQAGYGVGRGTSDASVVYPIPHQSMISDSDIRAALQNQVNSGILANPDANRLYVVYVPANTRVLMGGVQSQGNFDGYHGAFTGVDAGNHAIAIHYAVVITDTNYDGTIDASRATVVASHELTEAVTDPNMNGWYDDANGQEIGDLAQDAPGVLVNGGNGYYYYVQKEVDKFGQFIVPMS